MTTSTTKGSVFKVMSIRKQSILIVLSTIAGLIFPTASSADELTQQSVKQQVVIQAPASEVWAVVGDFFALDKWHPAVLASQKIDDKTRKLSLDEEGKVTLTEELTALDTDSMMLGYAIIDMAVVEKLEYNGAQIERKSLPVDSYSSTIQVMPGDNDESSKVIWAGEFFRAYTVGTPTPEGMDDATAVTTITAVYNAGLENLAKQFDGDNAGMATAAE